MFYIEVDIAVWLKNTPELGLKRMFRRDFFLSARDRHITI